MTPLIFAAAAAMSVVIPPGGALPPDAHFPDAATLPLLQRNALAAGACAKLDTQTVAPDGVRIFKKLNELPWGVMEHAVWRTVSGCPVREIVFRGETYYLAAGTPRVERLNPAGWAPVTPLDRPDGH
jgi:hypothetical protein